MCTVCVSFWTDDSRDVAIAIATIFVLLNMGCGEYDWTVRVWRQCWLMSKYFDHLLWSPYVIWQTVIFLRCGFFFFFVSFFPFPTKSQRSQIGCLPYFHPNRSQPLLGRSSPYHQDIWRRYCCLTTFFRLSIRALVANIWPDKFVRWCADEDIFCVLHFQRAACSRFCVDRWKFLHSACSVIVM